MEKEHDQDEEEHLRATDLDKDNMMSARLIDSKQQKEVQRHP